MNKLIKLFRHATGFIAVSALTLVTVSAQVIELNYDFGKGDQGWSAGFAQYSPAYNVGNSHFQLFGGLRLLPRKLTRTPRWAFFVQGQNNSAALFMFLKHRLNAADGIVAGRAYRIEYTLRLASNAPSNCVGAGSSPGEGVILKVGASPIEPMAGPLPDGFLMMNVDKGFGFNSGPAASVAGNIANGIDCERVNLYFPYAFIDRSHQHTSIVTASNSGELWLLVGTESGFEGMTQLYYQKIGIKLTPA